MSQFLDDVKRVINFECIMSISVSALFKALTNNNSHIYNTTITKHITITQKEEHLGLQQIQHRQNGRNVYVNHTE